VFSFQWLERPRISMPLNGARLFTWVEIQIFLSEGVLHIHMGGRVAERHSAGEAKLESFLNGNSWQPAPSWWTKYSYATCTVKHTTVISNTRSQDAGEFHTSFPNMEHFLDIKQLPGVYTVIEVPRAQEAKLVISFKIRPLYPRWKSPEISSGYECRFVLTPI
jgi:hypothetical protein